VAEKAGRTRPGGRAKIALSTELARPVGVGVGSLATGGHSYQTFVGVSFFFGEKMGIFGKMIYHSV